MKNKRRALFFCDGLFLIITLHAIDFRIEWNDAYHRFWESRTVNCNLIWQNNELINCFCVFTPGALTAKRTNAFFLLSKKHWMKIKSNANTEIDSNRYIQCYCVNVAEITKSESVFLLSIYSLIWAGIELWERKRDKNEKWM